MLCFAIMSEHYECVRLFTIWNFLAKSSCKISTMAQSSKLGNALISYAAETASMVYVQFYFKMS